MKIKTLVICSLLSALSIVLGKFLAIPIGDTIRFSFESMPLFLAGFMFGPVFGGVVGLVSDLLGSLLRGYSINLLITLGAVIIGVLGGTFNILLKKQPLFIKIFLSVLISHIIGSVIIKTFGLSLMYGTPYKVLILWRILNYTIITLTDTLVLYFLYKSKSFNKLLRSL